MAKLRKLLVIGAGPAGLMAAMRGRQLGLDVEIHADHFPRLTDPMRVECVPAQVIALLVEFGVHPSTIGVDELFEQRTTQWSDHEPLITRGPPVAHIGRPALDLALFDCALQAGATMSTPGAGVMRHIREGGSRECSTAILDASGRSAITATQRTGARAPLVARLFHMPANGNVPSKRAPGRAAFGIAAGPHGYAYRLANMAGLTIGVVGRGEFVRGGSCQIISRVADFARWLVEDIPHDSLDHGGSGAASAQWSGDGDRGVERIGDAAFARDALASQGLAVSFSDALRAVGQLNGNVTPILRTKKRDAITAHCAQVSRLIQNSRFSASEPWRDYVIHLQSASTLI